MSSSITSAAMPSMTAAFSSAISPSLPVVMRYSSSSASIESTGSERSARNAHL